MPSAAFAINGGGLGADAGALYYRAPDTLEWEPLELSYTDFLRWALGGGLEEFYEGLRWPGWQTDAQAWRDQGFSFYPFLWTRGSPSTSSRKAVDVAELYAMNAGRPAVETARPALESLAPLHDYAALAPLASFATLDESARPLRCASLAAAAVPTSGSSSVTRPWAACRR